MNRARASEEINQSQSQNDCQTAESRERNTCMGEEAKQDSMGGQRRKKASNTRDINGRQLYFRNCDNALHSGGNRWGACNGPSAGF